MYQRPNTLQKRCGSVDSLGGLCDNKTEDTREHEDHGDPGKDVKSAFDGKGILNECVEAERSSSMA